MLQRLTQIVGAFLHLVEQPRILDRDHRLVGERFEEGDLFAVERLGLASGGTDGADHRALPDHRRKDRGVEAEVLGPSSRARRRGEIIHHWRVLQHLFGHHRAPAAGMVVDRTRELVRHL